MKKPFYIFPIFIVIFFCNKKSNINPEIYNVELINQNNETIYWRNLPSQYKLIFFGYTQCPDICSIALHTMDKAKMVLANKKITLIFITIDPDRDTPQRIKNYLSNFNTPIIGITGNKDKLNIIYKIFNVRFHIHKNESSHRTPTQKNLVIHGYNHTPFIYVLDPDNKIISTYPTGISYITLVEELRKFL